MKNKREFLEISLGDTDIRELSKIPIQFLFREPRLVKLDNALVFLRDHQPGDLSTLYDLFIVDLFKRTPIRRARDYVFENKDRLIAAYSYYTNKPTIPSDVSFEQPLGIMAERFVREFVDRMHCRNSILIPEEAEKRKTRIELFESEYDDREILRFSLQSLAEKYGMTTERIRQLQKGTEETIGITQCRGVLKGVLLVDDFIVNHIFQSKFFDLCYSNQNAFRLSSFIEENGIQNEKTCRFLLDLLDLVKCESNVYFEPLVIKGNNIIALNRSAGILMKFFTDSTLFVSLVDDVAPFLHKRLNNNKELTDILLDIVRCSTRFEKKPNDNRDLYALKWQYLQTIPSKIVRILYDSGQPMHNQQIFEEYNRRASLYGIAPLTNGEQVIRGSHPLLQAWGKSGYWYFKSERSEAHEMAPDIRDVLESFLKSRAGKAYLSDVISFIASIGRPYSSRTIRIYLGSMCHVAREEKELFIHNDFLASYPEYTYASKVKNQVRIVMPIIVKYLAEHDGAAKMKDLIEYYRVQTGERIRNSALRIMIEKYPSILRVESISSHKLLVVLCISKEEAIALTRGDFSQKRSPHHLLIIEKAREALLASNKGIMPLKELYEYLNQFVPQGRNKNIVYRLLKNDSSFESYLVEKKRYIRLSTSK